MKFVKRDYWNKGGDHRPYRNICHEFVDGKEQKVSANPMAIEAGRAGRIARTALDELPDGTVFEIRVVPTGEKVKGYFQLTEPHTYSWVEELGERELKRQAGTSHRDDSRGNPHLGGAGEG